MNRTREFLKDCVEWDIENWSRAISFWDEMGIFDELSAGGGQMSST